MKKKHPIARLTESEFKIINNIPKTCLTRSTIYYDTSKSISNNFDVMRNELKTLFNIIMNLI